MTGEPLIGCFGFLNMNKRIPQLLEAFASLRRLASGRAAAARRRRRRALRRAAPARAARARPTGSSALDYVPEERMWSLMAACDVLVNLRYPTMGETSGSVIRALSLGQAARRLRRRLVQRAARRRRAQGAGRRARGRDDRGGARRRRRSRRGARRGRARVRRARARSAGASPTRTSSALEVAAGGDARRRRGAAGASPRRPPRPGSRTCRCSRSACARSASVRRARPRRPGVGVARGARRLLDARALRVRPPHGRAVDHDRRDRLLGAREELRGDRVTSRFARCRRRGYGDRLPDPDQPGVRALPLDPDGLHGRSR